jgi:hypothetical protein
LAGDLGLIHCRWAGETSELNEKIEECEREKQRTEHGAAYDGNHSPLVEGVQDVLETFFCVCHFMIRISV